MASASMRLYDLPWDPQGSLHGILLIPFNPGGQDQVGNHHPVSIPFALLMKTDILQTCPPSLFIELPNATNMWTTEQPTTGM